ncbi:acetyl-CoA carboxylase biotin carboxyl carrier protein [Panacagrimonas sp.]|uniref:acetyl-CoA carboxylase biotin carboxyl carrier protein n=1 Tax=Panacagrimonas sp. TaxID=2480088 RepID=UPI003B5292F2
MSTPTPRDVQALMELFESSDWKELDLRADGFELYLSKDPSRRRHDSASPAPAPREHSDAPSPSAPAAPVTAPAAQAVPANWTAIKAPNLGTFYRSPKPGAAPYVEIGQSVSPDTEVCLIEVMKLFTSVRAGIAGVVRQIAVQDAEMVEHDQVLLYIEPA